jgi:hypothetical protein
MALYAVQIIEAAHTSPAATCRRVMVEERYLLSIRLRTLAGWSHVVTAMFN